MRYKLFVLCSGTWVFAKLREFLELDLGLLHVKTFFCFMCPFHFVHNQMICAWQNHFCIWGAFMSSGLLHCTSQIYSYVKSCKW